MLSKIQKWGNSQGVRIPKILLEDSDIETGEEVDISVRDGKIIIESQSKIHGKYKIKDLVSRMPKKHLPKEEKWGLPVGREEW